MSIIQLVTGVSVFVAQMCFNVECEELSMGRNVDIVCLHLVSCGADTG